MSSPNRTNQNYARFMMYFKPSTLNELRVLSRMLNIAMVDFVNAAMQAYVFAREKEIGTKIPPRKQKRYVGPRTELLQNRVRYVMRLEKDVVERLRDIAYFDNQRFTNVCDEALSDFIRFTKQAKNLNNVWLSRSDVEAIRGRKSLKSSKTVRELLSKYMNVENQGRDKKVVEKKMRSGRKPMKKRRVRFR